MKISLIALTLLAATGIAQAGSATWNLNPTNGDWNTAANWTPATVPNGSADIATFGVSNTTALSLSASVEVNEVTFNSGASAYTLSISDSFILTISGAGIANNSGMIQRLTIHGSTGAPPPTITFTNSATAGSQTDFTNEGGTPSGGLTLFHGSSTAGSGNFTNFSATVSGQAPGSVQFFDQATAANGTFINNGSTVVGTSGSVVFFFSRSNAGNGVFTLNGSVVAIGGGGQVNFFENSSASRGTFTATGGRGQNGGGAVYFEATSTASRATLIATGGVAQGGQIQFLDDARGSEARVETFGNGTLGISGHHLPGVSIGSIEGGGVVELGANSLTVGSNNLSTTFAGVVQGTGSLTKGGTGTLILTNANTYTGGTSVNQGTLLIRNSSGSATGSGTVLVSAGTFGGSGTSAGAVTVGTGSGAGATLSPGRSPANLGTLTIQGALSFNSEATYTFGLDTDSAAADKVSANGVSIDAGAQFSFVGVGSAALPLGTVFNVISNTSATPGAGAFVNLPDGSTFTAGSNSFQVSYSGGDGNDLTLTVVP